jgi:hypothetical protein
MGSPRADMSWPQGGFGSMESHDSDQCGCDKQRSRHSESVIVTELPCALACELQKGDEDFLLGACFWIDFICYSDSIVKFASSGCPQINGSDPRNDVDKLQLDVKISITSHSNYLELLTMDETKFTLEPLLTHCQTKEQQLDYKALKFSEVKWSSTAHIRKPRELSYLVGYTRKAPLLRITFSVLFAWSNFGHFAWCANIQEKNQ